MNDWPALDHFLRTDPRDVGCDQAMEMLHIYARHVPTPEDAIDTFFRGETVWNAERHRFETLRVELATRLVVRESTAPPRAGA